MEQKTLFDRAGKDVFVIAIEGLDAVGKHTQATILDNDLGNSDNCNSMTFSFPNYASSSSQMVRDYLRGNCPSCNSKVVSTMYALDRYLTLKYDCSFNEMLNNLNSKNNFIIFDRFVGSNITHQVANANKDIRDEVATFIYSLEHKHYGLPIPDLTIYLDLDPEVSAKLLKERAKSEGKSIDILDDIDTQRNIYSVGKDYITRMYNNVCIVDCNSHTGGIKTIGQISDQIYDLVVRFFGL